MIQANILEQFVILYKIFINNKNISNIIIVTLVSLLFLILANIFKNKKITKIICILIYTSIFGYFIYNYYNQILSLLDYLMNNIFILLFFPNLAVYIIVLFIINFIVIRSSLSLKEKKFNKYLNITFFGIFNIIFYLIINNIIDNKIDVYQSLNIYTNSNLLNLIVLSMKLFIIWLIILILVKVIERISIYTTDRKQINNNLVLETVNNSDELKLLDSKSENEDLILEIVPNQNIEKKYNYYNDYIDIEPIKKYKDNLQNVFDNTNRDIIVEENTPEIEVNEHFNEIVEIQENNILEKEKLINQIPTLDELLSTKRLEIPNMISKNIIEEEPIKLDIDLKSYDNIFEPISITHDYNQNMNNIFTTNNYLQSIIFDIDKLKNNQNDKKQIKEIYDNIRINADNLSLNDYNYLISRLLEIKK